MKNNRLLIALVVLIGVGALAVTASRSHQAETTLEAPVEKLPTIKKEDLTEVEIVKPSKETIKLAKQGGAWKLVQPPANADMTAVDSVLDKLTTLDITGVAATRKENHAKLQVDDGTALRVKAKAGDKLVLDLFVGASKNGNTMVRLDGKDTVLIAKGGLRFAFDKEAKMFRDRVITDIDSNELTGLVVESTKGSFKFDKAGTAWKQAAGQKPIKDFSDAKVQSLASTLSRLRAADFAEPTVSPDAAGFSVPDAKVTLTGKTGAPTVLELGKQHPNGTEYYARVSGKDIIFRISKFTADRMISDASAFAEDKKEEGKDGAGAPGMPTGMMPPGGEGAPSQIPPELMEQLQRQLANQGGAHP